MLKQRHFWCNQVLSPINSRQLKQAVSTPSSDLMRRVCIIREASVISAQSVGQVQPKCNEDGGGGSHRRKAMRRMAQYNNSFLEALGLQDEHSILSAHAIPLSRCLLL